MSSLEPRFGKDSQPPHRIVDDDEVAKAAMKQISDLASAITGAMLDANGGEFIP